MYIDHAYIVFHYYFLCVAFEDCIRGRTVSAVWHCRQENAKMKNCLAS